MLPFFYHPALAAGADSVTLDEPASKHCIQVLRMQEGEAMLLTDGLGQRALVQIIAADRKRCAVQVTERVQVPPRPFRLALGIAFTKNNSRNEWLLEKATEAGVEHIYPLVCARSEKEKFNPDRLNNILIAAMLQSQQCHLPVLHEPLPLKKAPGLHPQAVRLIAHCREEKAGRGLLQQLPPQQDAFMLIGPEGDFTGDEVSLCLSQGFLPVSLGANRLRTETAGLYVCMVFNALNDA